MNTLQTEKEMMERDFSTPPPLSWFEDYKLPDGWKLVHKRLEGKKVLDIGCASGWVGYHAQKEGATVVCTDIFGTYVTPEVDFMKADKENLPFKNEWFDFVLTSNVLHHGDLLKTCTEAYRVLKRGGEFITFIEPCIPISADESSYLKDHCGEELKLGIDEHRPNMKLYKDSLMVFNRVEIYLSNEISVKPNAPEDFEGAICIRAIK